MAVRQRPQAPELLYKLRPIVLSIAPCWHAITQTVFTFDFCLVFFFFFPLAYFEPHLLTHVPLQQQGALPALCLILWHLCLSLCSHSLVGTRCNSITERRIEKVEPLLVETFGGLISLVVCSLFLHFIHLSHSISSSLSPFLYTHIHTVWT